VNFLIKVFGVFCVRKMSSVIGFKVDRECKYITMQMKVGV